MAFFWCEHWGVSTIMMNVEAADLASAVRRFEDFNDGLVPHVIDGRDVAAYCFACWRPIFAGEYRHEVHGIDADGGDHGREGTACLRCLTGHEIGGQG